LAWDRHRNAAGLILGPKDFKIIWLSDTLALRVSDEGFYQRASKRCIIIGAG
jgi:hypothetical protein